jgi:hypothetical protein
MQRDGRGGLQLTIPNSLLLEVTTPRVGADRTLERAFRL